MLGSWMFWGILVGVSWFAPSKDIRNTARLMLWILLIFAGLSFLWTVLLLALSVGGLAVMWVNGAILRARFATLIDVYRKGQVQYRRLQDEAHEYYWDRVWARGEGRQGPAYDPELSRVYHNLDGGTPREIWRLLMDRGLVPRRWVPTAEALMERNLAPPTMN